MLLGTSLLYVQNKRFLQATQEIITHKLDLFIVVNDSVSYRMCAELHSPVVSFNTLDTAQ